LLCEANTERRDRPPLKHPLKAYNRCRMSRTLEERLARWREKGLNEEATLLGLVLPVLQEAGYDPFNPDEVFPQLKDTNALKPDLALYKKSPLEGGEPWMVVEVKALGKALKDHQNQVVQYMNGVHPARWYALTNGEEWEFFDRDQGLPLKTLLRVRLSDPGAVEALRAMLDKSNPAPKVEEARHLLAEARLRQAAKEVPWEEQVKAYRVTEALPRRVKEEVEAISRGLGLEVEGWKKAYEASLRSGKPPSWWEAASPPLLKDLPPTGLPSSGPFKSWAEVLYQVAAWCRAKDPSRAEKVFRFMPKDYQGPLHVRPLPSGEEVVSVNYSTKGVQRLLGKAAQLFPELRGLELWVKGTVWRIE